MLLATTHTLFLSPHVILKAQTHLKISRHALPVLPRMIQLALQVHKSPLYSAAKSPTWPMPAGSHAHAAQHTAPCCAARYRPLHCPSAGACRGLPAPSLPLQALLTTHACAVNPDPLSYCLEFDCMQIVQALFMAAKISSLS